MAAGKSYAHGTSIEAKFFQLASKRGWKLYRSGWPDFLLLSEGKLLFVEVKSANDRLSATQLELFEALSKLGIRVRVWWERTPDRLIHWRRFADTVRQVDEKERAILARREKRWARSRRKLLRDLRGVR